ncbi:MAG: MerR family transcriptional regulator [Microbacteriaceae bacterium]
MKIGELARRTGVSVRSLRYYEEQQLLASTRTPSGQRIYDESAVGYVELVQVLFRAGVTSRVVRDILPCATSGATTPDMIERLRAQRAEIATRLEELAMTRDRLDRILVDATARLSTG